MVVLTKQNMGNAAGSPMKRKSIMNVLIIHPQLMKKVAHGHIYLMDI